MNDHAEQIIDTCEYLVSKGRYLDALETLRTHMKTRVASDPFAKSNALILDDLKVCIDRLEGIASDTALGKYCADRARTRISNLRQPVEAKVDQTMVDRACKAYDASVDYLGDSAMEHYCNDVPMWDALRAALGQSVDAQGDGGAT